MDDRLKRKLTNWTIGHEVPETLRILLRNNFQRVHKPRQEVIDMIKEFNIKGPFTANTFSDPMLVTYIKTELLSKYLGTQRRSKRSKRPHKK
jgi:hypothetical protein